MVGTVSSCSNNKRGKTRTEGQKYRQRILPPAHNRKNTTAHKRFSTCTHLLASKSVWLLLTVVPGHSVPEAETCRALHKCGWRELQCAWAPGHRESQGGEVVRQKYTIREETNKGWQSARGVGGLKTDGTFTLLSSAGVWAWPLLSSSSFSISALRTAVSGGGERSFLDCAHTYVFRHIYTNRHSKSRSQTCTGKHNLRYAQPYSTYAYPHRQRHTAVFTSRLLSYLFLHAALSLLTLLTSLPLIKEGNREEKIKCLRQDVRGCILQSEWNFFCSKSYLQITCSLCCKKDLHTWPIYC